MSTLSSPKPSLMLRVPAPPPRKVAARMGCVCRGASRSLDSRARPRVLGSGALYEFHTPVTPHERESPARDGGDGATLTQHSPDARHSMPKTTAAPRKSSPARPRSASTAPLDVSEIAQAIEACPELAPRVIALRDDPKLSKPAKMRAIAALVRDDASSTTLPQLQELSPLAARQASFRPSSAQIEAQRKAAQEQNARAQAAEAKRIHKPVGRVWSSFGGEVIPSLLQHVDLVDARYLLSLHAHGGVVPRWQDLPPSARIGPANVWRLYAWSRMFSLPILVLTYPWLDAEHPDRLGEHLGRVVPILQHMLAFCGGDDFTVGVVWDYCSLPQPERTPEEAQRFAAGLGALMRWFFHPYTHVLAMTSPLPTGAAYTNTRPYEARGWCELERRACHISKCVHCMWDLRGYSAEALEGLDGMQLFDALREMLRTGREPPMTPTLFEKAMRARVEAGELSFTAPDDLELILQLFRDGFRSIFETYRAYDPDGFFAAWAAMGWGEAEAKRVAAALSYAAKHCTWAAGGRVSLRLEGNAFGHAGQRAIEQAVRGSKGFESTVQF